MEAKGQPMHMWVRRSRVSTSQILQGRNQLHLQAGRLMVNAGLLASTQWCGKGGSYRSDSEHPAANTAGLGLIFVTGRPSLDSYYPLR